MSSVTRSTQQQSSEPTTKKKLGKNLNKLTKPPAPPISSAAKVAASSRNGLLLLSTKRPSSGPNAVPSSGGILSNKSSQTASKPLPSLGLQYASNTSTHDALLGAVVGASRAEAEHQPDAWGVADKKGSVGEVTLRSEDGKVAQEVPSSDSPVPQPQNYGIERGLERQDADDHSNELPSSNWDEYGGRQLSAEKHDNDPDVQGAYMSQLARDRAEKRLVEEDARQSEQKERAAQRLRELEQKMVPDAASEEVSSQPEVDDGDHSSKPKFVLEKLGRSQSMPEEHEHAAHHSGTPSADRSSQRTLYDPNRTYSSLVGGEADASKNDKDSRSGPPEPSNQLRNGRMAPGAYSPDPQSFNDSRDPKYSRQPMIHLSSYEDRDRGERGTSAGPRMLYDPKSGSMVAVPSREDAAANARGRKDRGKKGRNSRDKEAKADLKLDSNDASKGGRKGKQRRDENGQQRGKESASPAKIVAKKASVNSERKLPRTCGVLYTKDSKGNYYCADGCDGDLGYGAHSVPGGRTRNPDAYANFVESQEQIHEEDIDMFDNHHLETSYDADALQQDSAPAVTLHTGFSVPEAKEVKLDWLKPNEKIELITGIDDSPTLQATAKEWAPSQAALAAAVAAAEKEKAVLSTSAVDSVEGHDEDDDDDAPFGLGFDPTLNMDSVMQSPSAEPAGGLDAVDLAALSLEPAMTGAAKSTHIFAFESGSTWGSNNTSGVNGATWGSTNTTSGSNAWGVPSSGNAFSNDDPNKSVMATTFLSLSSTNTWGAVPGLGGTSLGGSSLNGEHTRSTGD